MVPTLLKVGAPIIGVPPEGEVNQLIVEPGAVAVAVSGMITTSAHLVAVPKLVGGAGAGLIVSVTLVLGLGLVQLPLYVSA